MSDSSELTKSKITVKHNNYFDKMASMFSQMGDRCPNYDQIKKLFPNSPRLQEAISGFYRIVVIFCTRVLRFLQAAGNLPSYTLNQTFINKLGLTNFAKSLWTSFKEEFNDIDKQLSDQQEAINEKVR